MNLLDLTTALVDRRLTLSLVGESIYVAGDPASLTPEIAAAIRDHKPALVGCLSSRQSDLSFADSPAAAEGLAECLRYFEELAGDVTAARTGRTVLRWPCPMQTPCRRCGGADACAVVIHEGASIRRDCARCGAFRDFPIWLDEPEVAEFVQHALEFGTIQEASRPGAGNAEAALTETP